MTRSISSLICHVVIGSALALASDVGKSYHVYHKLGDASTITSRGRISITPTDDSGLVARFHPDDSYLDVDSFDVMVEKNLLYTIVILEDVGDNLPSEFSYPPSNGFRFVSTSVPGCSIRRSNLKEEIGLSISPTGKLMSVSYRPIISPLAPSSCHQLKPLSDKPETIFARRGGGKDDEQNNTSMPFKTIVSFHSHTPMMVVPGVITQSRPPPGLKWYRRNAKNNPSPMMGGTKQEGGGGIPGIDDEPPSGWKSSFLYRYWYIILPMAIVGLFGGADDGDMNNQQRAGAGVQQMSRTASSTTTATAAAGVTVGGSAVVSNSQRRGKRD